MCVWCVCVGVWCGRVCEHTIQWARCVAVTYFLTLQFEALFFQKPSMYSKFWDSLSPQKLLQVCADVALIILYAWFQFQYATQALKEQQIPDGVVKVVKMLGSAPRDWPSCVQLARIKFEKYFNHKVLASTIISTCTC